MLTVIKAGGAWLDGSPVQDELDALAELPGEVVVVHGGGKEISRWQERCGIETEWSEGLRVTRGDSLALSSMVLSGWLNKKLATAVSEAGRPSVGLSGEDGGIIHARPIDPARLGSVGSVDRIDPAPLEALLAGGFTPVLSPISKGAAGPLNVNADEAAAQVAIAMGADRLLLVSDVAGVKDGSEVLDRVTRDDAGTLSASGVLEGGMAVKVDQGLAASDREIEVRIGGGELLADPAAGTAIGTAPTLAAVAS
ncbi:MAG: acetylglutamate kinase [Gemmatimonadales bacterium]|nr:MAG: acetylglutamate kinase [Gemmatimonadales bacterium]